MPALPLFQLARKACHRNIRSITDIGEIPYELVRPVLIKLENPEQLRELEAASPHIVGLDAEIWKGFIKRDIPDWESKPHEPRNPANWHRVYRKLLVESRKDIDADALALKATLDGLKTERAKHTSKVIAPVPQKQKRVQRTAGLVGNSSVLSFSSGSKTKMLTGKGVLDKARREAKEMSVFSARKTLLATPTHKLQNQASAVRQAPQGLLDDHRRPRPTAYEDAKLIAIRAPRKKSVVDTTGVPMGQTTEEKERRLKALTNPDLTMTQFSTPSSRPQNTSVMSPPPANAILARPSTAYTVPRMKYPSPEASGKRPSPSSTRIRDDPFMPAKRRRAA